MGLIMLGSGSAKVVDEMLTYAKETQHEKIIRSLAVGIGFVNYGQRDLANPLIENLMNEKVGLSLHDSGAMTITCKIIEARVSLTSRTGRHLAIWSNVHLGPGARWYSQQLGYPKIASRRCLRCQ